MSMSTQRASCTRQQWAIWGINQSKTPKQKKKEKKWSRNHLNKQQSGELNGQINFHRLYYCYYSANSALNAPQMNLKSIACANEIIADTMCAVCQHQRDSQSMRPVNFRPENFSVTQTTVSWYSSPVPPGALFMRFIHRQFLKMRSVRSEICSSSGAVVSHSRTRHTTVNQSGRSSVHWADIGQFDFK